MLGSLIPWKKKDSELQVQRYQDPLVHLRQEFDQIWERFWDDWRSGTMSIWDQSRWFDSPVSFNDDEKQYVLRAELPGFDPKEIDVKVSGNVLTLRAEHKEEEKRGNGSYHHVGSFVHTITLPQGVISDQIDAQYRHGVLEVHLPKSAESQAKRIEVKAV